MKKLIFLLCLLFACVACKEQNPPTPGGSGGGGSNGGNSGGGTPQSVEVDFSYQLTAPFWYSFTNKSQGVDSYKWDFGDGSFSTNKDAMHVYETTGTYTVTLTGTASGVKYDCQKKITVKKPDIYIAGYTLYKIPYENKYYKVVCEDDDWFGTDWGFSTVYTPLLDKSDIPYIKYFNTPLLMDKLDGDDYYTFYVYHTTNTSSSSGDTQCLKKKLSKSAIYEYKDEHILTSDNGQTQLGIIMEYRYQ